METARVKQLIGVPVTITKSGMTEGAKGVIDEYDFKANKYIVRFTSPWVGWYHRCEFRID